MDCNKLTECLKSLEISGTKPSCCKIGGCLEYCDKRKKIVVEENKKKYFLENESQDCIAENTQSF